ncbi:MAG: hypothetical protein N3C62_03745 [Synergistetes bacterium]|nr:hypothetical protein [Synergistota bacterium]MCX8127840.1 hypothetical protein [Synergistota bacterium]MDW8192102.1 hypothetical protein [Synergistota bacterium]
MEERETLNELAKVEETKPTKETRELVIRTLKEILPTDEFRELIQETLRPSIEYRLLRDEFTLLSARLEASFEGFRREISALASELKADYRILKEEILSSAKEATNGIKETTLNLKKSSEDTKEKVEKSFSKIEESLNHILDRVQNEITETLQKIDIKTPISEITRKIEAYKEEMKISLSNELKSIENLSANIQKAISEFETKISTRVNERLSIMEELFREVSKETKDTLSKMKSELEAQKLDIQTHLRENGEKLVEQINSLHIKLNGIENKMSSVNTKTFINLLLILLSFGGVAFIITKLMSG